jgi:hypothetical protein
MKQYLSLKSVVIEPESALIDLRRIEFFTRDDDYIIGQKSLRILQEQKPTILGWFASTVNRNKHFNLSVATFDEDTDRYELEKISLEDSLKILDNGYLLPSIRAVTSYYNLRGTVSYSDGSIGRMYEHCNAQDEWEYFCKFVKISFDGIQSGWRNGDSSEYGEDIYLWTGNPPCIN